MGLEHGLVLVWE
jgi:hypothetical protein